MGVFGIVSAGFNALFFRGRRGKRNAANARANFVAKARAHLRRSLSIESLESRHLLSVLDILSTQSYTVTGDNNSNFPYSGLTVEAGAQVTVNGSNNNLGTVIIKPNGNLSVNGAGNSFGATDVEGTLNLNANVSVGSLSGSNTNAR